MTSRDAARADFCRFLAACYYEPDPSFVEEGLFDSMAGVASHVDGVLEEASVRLARLSRRTAPEDLLVDYTRLFLGPVDAPARPYGCVWLGTGSTLMQDSTQAVLSALRGGRLRPLRGTSATSRTTSPPSSSSSTSCCIARTGALPGAGEARRLKARFLDEHLGRWADPFTEAVETHARTRFYRELAVLTRRFIAAETGRA